MADDVQVSFGGTIDDLRSTIEEAKAEIQGLTAPISGVMQAFGGLGEALGAAFAVDKVLDFVKSMGELGEQTERTAAILGISTQQVGELQYAFDATGTPVANLDQMMGRFEIGLSRPASSVNAVAAGLKALGLSAQELIGVPLPQQLDRIADATSHFADGVNKAAALQALGRGFVELIPLLDQGSGRLDHLRETADATNSVLDLAATQSLAHMNEGLVELGAAIKGDAIAAFAQLVPEVNFAVSSLTGLAQAFSNSVKSGSDMALILYPLKGAIDGVESAFVLVTGGVRTFAALGVSAAQLLAAGFVNFGQVVADVFKALVAAISGFFTALVAAGGEAVRAVEQQFIDLGTVIGDTLKLNFAGAKDALGNFGADAAASGAKIKGAFSGVFDMSAATDDLARGQLATAMIAQETADKIVAIGGKEASALRQIWDPDSMDPRGGRAGHAQTSDIAQKQQVPNLDLATQAKSKSAQDQLAVVLEEGQEEVSLTEKATNQKIALYDAEYKRKAITEDQKVQLTLDALQDELQDEQAVLNQELALDNLRPQQRQKILDQLATLEQNYASQVQKIQQDSAAYTAQQWQNAFTSINNAFTAQVQGLLTGTLTWSNALKSALTDLTADLIKFFVDWGLKWTENELMQIAGINTVTAAQVAGSAQQSAAQASAGAAGALAGLGNILHSIQASAAQTFAGVTGFMAPILGPAAPAAGAAAEATVLAVAGGLYDAGAWEIPHDMLAGVHQGEMIVPSRGGIASEFRDFLSGGASPPGGGGASVHIHPTANFNVSAVDSASTAQWMRNNSADIAKAMNEAARHGALLGLRRLAGA